MTRRTTMLRALAFCATGVVVSFCALRVVSAQSTGGGSDSGGGTVYIPPPDEDGGGSSGSSGSGAGGGRNYGDCGPCEEWVDDGSGQGGGCKKLYDPHTQGCCRKPDGSYEITDNPEDADLNQVAADIGACTPDDLGATFCYNGKKVSVLCPAGKMLDPELQKCVEAHEQSHRDDSRSTCQKCGPSGSQKSLKDYYCGECDAYGETMLCIWTKADPSAPGFKDFYEKQKKLRDYFCAQAAAVGC